MRLSAETQDPPRVELAPLIDVVFLVLVAFIETSVFATPKSGLPIELQDAETAAIERSALLEVEVHRDGTLYAEGRTLSMEELTALLERRNRADEEMALYLVADRRGELGRLLEVMDRARQAGIEGITVATAPEAVEDVP